MDHLHSVHTASGASLTQFGTGAIAVGNVGVAWKEFSAKHVTKCTLVGTIYDDLVQLILGVVSFSVLFIKWRCERARRPCKVWSFDSSKQAIGATAMHFTNIGIAMLFEKKLGVKITDVCGLYLIIFLLDSTAGTLGNYYCLALLHKVAKKCRWNSIRQSGHYGQIDGKGAKWGPYLKQTLWWLFILCFVKCWLMAIVYILRGHFEWLGGVVLSPLQSDPKTELIFTMVLCPLVINGIVFWVTDIFLKAPQREYGAIEKPSKKSCCCCCKSTSDMPRKQTTSPKPKPKGRSPKPAQYMPDGDADSDEDYHIRGNPRDLLPSEPAQTYHGL